MNTHITYATQHQQEKTNFEGQELRAPTPDTENDKAFDSTLEHADSEAAGGDPDQDTHVMGTIKYTSGENEYLVPSPTTDPQDPRNLPRWRKVIYVILLSMFASVGGSAVSGFGALLAFYRPIYQREHKSALQISNLATLPVVFEGLGNLIFVPIALSIGRRPAFLSCSLVIIIGCIIAKTATTYEQHMGARILIGLAVGANEALVPMMVQEIHFLHERGRAIAWQQAIQAIVSTVLNLCASPIAGAVGAPNYYLFPMGIMALQLCFSIFFACETRYTRSLADFQTGTHADKEGDKVKIADKPPLDLVKYQPRSFVRDMLPYDGQPVDFKQPVLLFSRMAQIIVFPTVFWAFCLNGIGIGVNVAMSATYAGVLVSDYHWKANKISLAQAGLLLVPFAAVPALGYASDRLIKRMAMRRNGIHEPETRLIPLVVPICIGVISSVLYGLGAERSHQYHWMIIICALPGFFFCFLGIHIATITYLLDAYPTRIAPMLILITAMRGFVAYAVSANIAAFVTNCGYLVAFGTFAGVTAALGLMAIPIYIYGKTIRRVTSKYVQHASGVTKVDG